MENYLYLNCPQACNYILYTQFDDIFKDIKDKDIDFTKENITYIYFFFCKSITEIITLFKIKEKTYLYIKFNLNIKLVEIDNLSDIKNYLSNTQMKLVGIQKDKFNKDYKKTIQSQGQSQNQNTHNSLNASNSKNVLNLTNNYTINDLELKTTISESLIEEIILNNNIHIKGFEWITNFPFVKCLTIHNFYQLTNESMDYIIKNCQHLEIINVHNCPNINIRILLSIYRSNKIKKILLNDKKLWCQIDMNKPFISDEEWRNLYNETITDIVINSEQLNLDIIDYIIKCTHNLSTFTMSQNIYNLSLKNLLQGSDKNRFITFLEWNSIVLNKTIGVKIQWRPTFNNMMKNLTMIKEFKR
jgi:hypothetical protein